MRNLDFAAEGSAARGDEERSRTWLIFEAAEQRLAVLAENVLEVTEMGEVTCLPRLPPHVAGVMVHRGGAVPVLDVGRFLGLTRTGEAAQESTPTRAVVTRLGEMTVSLVADRVAGLRALHDDDLEAPQALSSGLRRYSSHQVPDSSGLIAVLDLEKLLDDAKPRAGQG